MLFMCYWRSETERQYSRQAFGFIRAENIDAAREIMQRNLQKGYKVTKVIPAEEHWITPQSLTVNFVNRAEYRLFG